VISVVLCNKWWSCLSPATSDSKLSSPNVCESPVIIPDVAPPPICTTLFNIQSIPIIIHRLTAKFLLTALPTPTPWPNESGIKRKPTRPLCTRNININDRNTLCCIQLTGSHIVLLGICFHWCYLYSLLFHFLLLYHIYSRWLGEQFCYLPSSLLHILSLQ